MSNNNILNKLKDEIPQLSNENFLKTFSFQIREILDKDKTPEKVSSSIKDLIRENKPRLLKDDELNFILDRLPEPNMVTREMSEIAYSSLKANLRKILIKIQLCS